MRPFEFPLRRVLEWRRTQMELAENKLRRMAADLEELALAVVKLDLVRGRAEQVVRESAVADAGDLWALAAYRARLINEQRELTRRRREYEQQLALQRQRVLEAQRQCRLLEKLAESRRAEWRKAMDREMESQAAEAYLALWNRRR